MEQGGAVAETEEPPLLTPAQARERLLAACRVPPEAVGLTQVRKWMREGDLYLVVLGKKWFTPRVDVDRFAREYIERPATTAGERQASV